MNGYNNGRIGLSHREISEALGNSNLRRIGEGIIELIDHGFIDITVEGQWKQRMARQYRITFVSTAYAPFAATNEYRQWKPKRKSSHDEASAGEGISADEASAGRKSIDDKASARILAARRKTAENGSEAVHVSADEASTLIYSHTPTRKRGRENAPDSTGKSAGPSSAHTAKGRTGLSATAIRDRLESLLQSSPTGTQMRLADAAKIPGGVLAQFLADGKDLSAAHNVRLMLQMEKLERGEY
ncbi:hypothetical protein [Sphingobium tyrosinilyticum]